MALWTANIYKMKKISIHLLIPLIFIATTFAGVFIAYQYSIGLSIEASETQLRNKLSARLNFLQGTIEEFISLNAKEYAQQTMSSIAAESDLIMAIATTADGKILASTKYTLVNKSWQDVLPDSFAPQIELAINNNRPIILQEGKIFYGLTPLCGERNPSGASCGFIYYELSSKYQQSYIQSLLSQYTVYIIIFLFLVGIITTLLIQRIVNNPLTRINSRLNRFAQGERNIHILPQKTRELNELSSSINFLLLSIVANEKILSEREAKMRTIINTVAGAIITIDNKGVIENFNPGAEELFGYESSEVVGKNVKVLMPDPDRSKHDSYIQNYQNTGNAQIIGKGRETTAQRKNGTTFPIHLTVSETRIKDKLFFTGIIIDLTEQKRITKALSDANRELFTTNLALKESVRLDAMTKLYNRAFFKKNIESELNRATRYKFPVSVIMCDIDYFKKYNDFYGHQQGDVCIIEVAKLIKQSFSRSGEIAARYGGEEFIILIPNMHLSEVLERAEHLRESILAKKLPHKKSSVTGFVTISIGVTTYIPKDENAPPEVKEIIETADRALYQSKGEGRNRVSYIDFSPMQPNSSAQSQS